MFEKLGVEITRGKKKKCKMQKGIFLCPVLELNSSRLCKPECIKSDTIS